MVDVKIVTIDGPSGCGKSSIAQLLALKLSYNWLDSGAIYRLCAWQKLVNPQLSNIDLIKKMSLADIDFIAGSYGEASYVFFNKKDLTSEIRTDKVAQLASVLAQEESIRNGLGEIQQRFITPPGLVAEGRDMGTKIFPNAAVKIFLTASVEIRAKRRLKQLHSLNEDVNLEPLINSIAKRDARDLNRKVAPLVPAKNAVILDSSELSIEQVLADALKLVKQS